MSKKSIYKTISFFNVETFKNCNDMLQKKIHMKKSVVSKQGEADIFFKIYF